VLFSQQLTQKMLITLLLLLAYAYAYASAYKTGFKNSRLFFLDPISSKTKTNRTRFPALSVSYKLLL